MDCIKLSEGPTLYMSLIKEAIDEYPSEQIKNELNVTQAHIESMVKMALERGYRTGLIHGFQQGVQAEVNQKPPCACGSIPIPGE